MSDPLAPGPATDPTNGAPGTDAPRSEAPADIEKHAYDQALTELQ
jgi:hypothetical protein